MKINVRILCVLLYSIGCFARLSWQQELNMAGAILGTAQYQLAVSGMDDCQALQYFLQHELTDESVIPRAFIVNYLILREYQDTEASFDGCNLGFIPGIAGVLPVPADLSYANFSGSSFVGAKFHAARLNGVRFDSADMQNVILDKAVAATVPVVCNSANLTGASMLDSWLPGGYFHGAILSNAVFSHARLQGARFIGATMVGTKILYSDVHTADFTDANLTGADFANSHGYMVVDGANLTNADFSQTTLLFFSYNVNNLPTFANTILPNGELCSGSYCIKHFLDLEFHQDNTVS